MDTLVTVVAVCMMISLIALTAVCCVAFVYIARNEADEMQHRREARQEIERRKADRRGL